MTPEMLISLSVEPALSLLPERMDSPEARAMMVAIALQESSLRHRRQIARWDDGEPVYGPARGWYQFERGGGVHGVLTHAATSAHIARVCDELGYPDRAPAELHDAIEDNDVLAGAFARLNLWWWHEPLPTREQEIVAWQQYLKTWGPGKPHKDTWSANWARAWSVVGG